MTQEVANIKPSYPLFRDDDYQESLGNKREQCKECHPAQKIQETFDWTTTQE